MIRLCDGAKEWYRVETRYVVSSSVFNVQLSPSWTAAFAFKIIWQHSLGHWSFTTQLRRCSSRSCRRSSLLLMVIDITCVRITCTPPHVHCIFGSIPPTQIKPVLSSFCVLYSPNAQVAFKHCLTYNVNMEQTVRIR
jgi:hypothetical protein